MYTVPDSNTVGLWKSLRIALTAALVHDSEETYGQYIPCGAERTVTKTQMHAKNVTQFLHTHTKHLHIYCTYQAKATYKILC